MRAMEKKRNQMVRKQWKEMNLGERIRAVRQRLQKVNRRQYSLQSISRRTGVVSRQGLSQIELGKVKNPTAKVLGGIAADLGISLGFLLTGGESDEGVRAESSRGLQFEWEELRRRVADALSSEDASTEEGLDMRGLQNVKRLAEGEFDSFVKALGNLPRVPQGKPSETASRLEFEVAALNRSSDELDRDFAFQIWSRVSSLAACLEDALRPISRGGKEESREEGSLLHKVRRLSRCLEKKPISFTSANDSDHPISLRIEFEDLPLVVEYLGSENFPSRLVDEFKDRIRFEWEMLLRRAKRGD